MAKSYEELKNEISAITNEVEDGANTANRIGGAMADIADFAKESLESQEERINEETDSKISGLVVQETGDGEGVVMSQKAVTEKIGEVVSNNGIFAKRSYRSISRKLFETKYAFKAGHSYVLRVYIQGEQQMYFNASTCNVSVSEFDDSNIVDRLTPSSNLEIKNHPQILSFTATGNADYLAYYLEPKSGIGGNEILHAIIIDDVTSTFSVSSSEKEFFGQFRKGDLYKFTIIGSTKDLLQYRIITPNFSNQGVSFKSNNGSHEIVYEFAEDIDIVNIYFPENIEELSVTLSHIDAENECLLKELDGKKLIYSSQYPKNDIQKVIPSDGLFDKNTYYLKIIPPSRKRVELNALLTAVGYTRSNPEQYPYYPFIKVFGVIGKEYVVKIPNEQIYSFAAIYPHNSDCVIEIYEGNNRIKDSYKGIARENDSIKNKIMWIPTHFKKDVEYIISISTNNIEGGILNASACAEANMESVIDLNIFRFSENNTNGDYNIGNDAGAVFKFIPSADSHFLAVYVGATSISDIEVSIIENIGVNGMKSKLVNPLVYEDCSDPTVWYDADAKLFYCMGSPWAMQKPIYKSSDMVTWEKVNRDFLTPLARTQALQNYKWIWAPDVVKIGNYYMMYCSLVNSAESSAIGIFKSKRADGDWDFVKSILPAKETGIIDTIDPEVVIGNDNKVYLFYGSTGGIHRVELTDDGCDVAEGAEPIHVMGAIKDFANQRARSMEGLYLYRRKEWWYAFVSTGEYYNDSYKLKVGRAASLTDDFKDKDGISLSDGVGGSVILQTKDDRFEGPGHNGEIFETKDGKTWMYYHCHVKEVTERVPGLNVLARPVLLQEIKWDSDGWPYFENGCPAAISDVPIL